MPGQRGRQEKSVQGITRGSPVRDVLKGPGAVDRSRQPPRKGKKTLLASPKSFLQSALQKQREKNARGPWTRGQTDTAGRKKHHKKETSPLRGVITP